MSESKDFLNDWNYCDPEKRQNKLPMPYRIIDEILNEQILASAYTRIFEILKYDKDPNYDGNLHESSFHSCFEIEGISCLSSDARNNINQVLVGDKFGCVSVLDLSKKQVLMKKQVAQSRILDICTVVNWVQDTWLVTFSVIARGDQNVQVFRYNLFENKIYLQYTIKCAKSVQKFLKNSEIGELPYKSKLSQEHGFIAIGMYNGDVEIFKLPNLFEDLHLDATAKQPSLISLLQNFQVKDIQKSHHLIKIDKQKKEKDFKQVFEDFLNNTNQTKVVQQEVQAVLAKNVKVDPKLKEVKKEQHVVQDTEIDYIIYNTPQFYGEQINDDEGGDITEDYNIPLQRLEFYFITQEIALPNALKTFNKVNCLDITTGIMVVQTLTTNFQYHDLQEFDIRNAPLFLLQQTQVRDDQSKISKEKKPTAPPSLPQKSPLPVFKPVLRSSFKTLYPIVICQMNPSNSFLALGLRDGSTLIWDVAYDCENGYPEKFQAPPSCLAFVNDSVLVLGSQDNQVAGYQVQTQDMIFKRSNQFRQKQVWPVNQIMGSPSGTAFVLDNSNTMRLQDSNLKVMMQCMDIRFQKSHLQMIKKFSISSKKKTLFLIFKAHNY